MQQKYIKIFVNQQIKVERLATKMEISDTFLLSA